VLVIDCRPETQIERVMRRNALPREQVLAILGAQAARRPGGRRRPDRQ
jgi:dephospho-CoA kinase